MQLSIEKDIEILNEIIETGWLISDFEQCTAIDACEDAITALKQYETVTEFADCCRECGAKYGKLLKDVEEIGEVIGCDADAETKCKMISNILTAKPHYFEKQESTDTWSIKDVADALVRHGLIVEQDPKIEQWIPVSERLPDDGNWAIFTDGTQISIERYKMDALDHFYPSGRWFNLEDAVAWMPLPEPYKTESESKRYAELAKSYVQGVRAGLAESEEV